MQWRKKKWRSCLNGVWHEVLELEINFKNMRCQHNGSLEHPFYLWVPKIFCFLWKWKREMRVGDVRLLHRQLKWVLKSVVCYSLCFEIWVGVVLGFYSKMYKENNCFGLIFPVVKSCPVICLGLSSRYQKPLNRSFQSWGAFSYLIRSILVLYYYYK